jgi:hypothetical protein
MWELLPEALLQLQHLDVDLLAITGDLLDVPREVLENPKGVLADQLRPAIREDYLRLRGLIDKSGIPYLVLPGNHDLHPLFWEVFDLLQHETFIENRCWVLRFCDHGVGEETPERNGGDLKRWEIALHPEAPELQVHLQHYLITPELNEKYPFTYRGGEAMKERMVASGKCILSLSGHYHRGQDMQREGRCHFFTGKAFATSPHPFYLHHLGEENVRTESFQLDHSEVAT